jgi:hypothetical protein
MSDGASRRAAAAVAGWLAYLAVDFVLHAVLFSGWWRATESYWLPPRDLAARIPFAYGAFALYVASLTWLMVRLLGPRPRLAQAISFGAIGGLAFGVASVLATYSALAMPVSALFVWPATMVVASAGAMTAAMATLRADRPWRRVCLVCIVALLLACAGVVFQTFFQAPAVRGQTDQRTTAPVAFS